MALETNIHALWGKKQTAKGTPATDASTHRLVQVAGDVAPARADGSENFSDLDRFGDMTDFVNTIVGEGSPGIQAHPDQLAWLCWIFFGQETVTGAADPWTHTTTPGTNGGFWSTVWKRVGQNVIQRQKFNDCRIGQLQIEGSTGSKVIRATPTILSLDPGEVYATDPAQGMPTDDPFLYTEGAGTFEINDVVMPGQSQFTAVWDENLGPYYGDDVVPVDLIVGNASISVAVTLLVDTLGHQEYNKRVYGSASPAPGTKPLKSLDPIGKYDFNIVKKTSAGAVVPAREFKLEMPGVKWSPDLSIPPNPEGGAAELSLTGSMRKIAGQAGSTVTIKNGVAAYTA